MDDREPLTEDKTSRLTMQNHSAANQSHPKRPKNTLHTLAQNPLHGYQRVLMNDRIVLLHDKTVRSSCRMILQNDRTALSRCEMIPSSIRSVLTDDRDSLRERKSREFDSHGCRITRPGAGPLVWIKICVERQTP